MPVYCDGCCTPLSANDDRIYTENGGALCSECRQAAVSSVHYTISVRIEKISINRRGVISTSVLSLPIPSDITRQSRKEALHIATLACQHLLQMDDSQRSVPKRTHGKP